MEKLAETAKAEKYYDQVKGQIDRLKLELGHSVDRDLDLFRKEISEILSDQLMSRYYMQEGVVEFRMRHDSDVAKAVDVLSDEEVYRKILK